MALFKTVEKTPEAEKTYQFSSASRKYNNFDEIKAVLKEYQGYINSSVDYENKNLVNLLSGIQNLFFYNQPHIIKVAATLVEYKFPEYFKTFLEYASKVGMCKSDNVSDTANIVLGILTNYTDVSKDFSKRLLELGYVKYYSTNLKQQIFLEKQNEAKVVNILTFLLGTLNNCARNVPDHESYQQENLKMVLKPYLSSKDDTSRTLTIMILSFIMSEDENSKFENAGSLPFMVKCVTKALNQSDRTYQGFSVIELLECLTRLAVNDTNKSKLIDAGLLPGIVKIMKTGGEDEQEMAGRLTWNLCFDENAKQKVIKEPGYLEVLDVLAKSECKAVKRAAKGAQWTISGEEKHRQNDSKPQSQSKTEKHIFISYQHTHQEMVVQIKDRLKKDGYKVWIDTEQMGGSTLDAMASAVENASVVLICASEKYKQSPNCRTEAAYTFQLKKPIVPLMMQRYYKADGWLGMLMGATMYVNFDGKFEFDHAYKLLMKELALQLHHTSNSGKDEVEGGPIVAAKAPFYKSIQAPKTEHSALKWDKKQVAEWVVSNNLKNLSSSLQKLFDNMNGSLLIRFCLLSKKAPEFFYDQLSKKFKLDMLSILKLEEALDTL